MFNFFLMQQLYQTLSDYDIRFYMYEILKVIYFLIAKYFATIGTDRMLNFLEAWNSKNSMTILPKVFI